MFPVLRRSLWLRLFRRPHRVHDLTPHLDDAARRLCRAPETPRRLDLHGSSGLRALHGRDPPPWAPKR